MKHVAQRGVSKAQLVGVGPIEARRHKNPQAKHTKHTYTDADVAHIKQVRQPRCTRAGQTKQLQERGSRE